MPTDHFKNVPREDIRKGYGGHDHPLDPRDLGDGFAGGGDPRPEKHVDPVELAEEGGPGREFTRADGSRSR